MLPDSNHISFTAKLFICNRALLATTGTSCTMLKRYYAIDPKGNLTSPTNFIWVQSATTSVNGTLRGEGSNAGAWRASGGPPTANSSAASVPTYLLVGHCKKNIIA